MEWLSTLETLPKDHNVLVVGFEAEVKEVAGKRHHPNQRFSSDVAKHAQGRHQQAWKWVLSKVADDNYNRG